MEENNKKNWKSELDSQYIYECLVQYEKDEKKKKLFQKLAKESLHQAGIWKNKSNQTHWSYSPGAKVKLTCWIIKHIGPKFILEILSAQKIRGISVYRQKDETPEHERVHQRITKGTNLRAAVFGINDGLVSNASLVFAMIGAQSSSQTVLLTGIAGLLAGAFSMAAGEYISVKSQTELFEDQIRIEKEELDEFPEEEAKELSAIYQAKGISEEIADIMANDLIKDPAKALDTLAREELGLNPDDLGSAFKAAISSFLAFSMGAIIPLTPYFWLHDSQAITISLGMSLGSLFAIGAMLSLFTGKSALLSGLRMTTIGLSAGAITFYIGKLIGVSL
ncbi:MAG: VIT1/CCC1 transporter family protein [Bacteriovoracaceae bacterium]|nr:VIT1/CCC1 transporter family protein [Bacteriovoracaceae bacterium]